MKEGMIKCHIYIDLEEDATENILECEVERVCDILAEHGYGYQIYDKNIK